MAVFQTHPVHQMVPSTNHGENPPPGFSVGFACHKVLLNQIRSYECARIQPLLFSASSFYAILTSQPKNIATAGRVSPQRATASPPASGSSGAGSSSLSCSASRLAACTCSSRRPIEASLAAGRVMLPSKDAGSLRSEKSFGWLPKRAPLAKQESIIGIGGQTVPKAKNCTLAILLALVSLGNSPFCGSLSKDSTGPTNRQKSKQNTFIHIYIYTRRKLPEPRLQPVPLLRELPQLSLGFFAVTGMPLLWQETKKAAHELNGKWAWCPSKQQGLIQRLAEALAARASCSAFTCFRAKV